MIDDRGDCSSTLQGQVNVLVDRLPGARQDKTVTHTRLRAGGERLPRISRPDYISRYQLKKMLAERDSPLDSCGGNGHQGLVTPPLLLASERDKTGTLCSGPCSRGVRPREPEQE